MDGRHAHLTLVSSRSLLRTVILVMVDFMLGGSGRIVFPIEGDGWSVGSGGISKCDVVGSYFEGRKRYISFHRVGAGKTTVIIATIIIVAIDGMVGIVHVAGADAGAEIVARGIGC